MFLSNNIIVRKLFVFFFVILIKLFRKKKKKRTKQEINKNLIEGLIENDLNECTLIGERTNLENEINFNDTDDIVFDRNDVQQIDFDRLQLKTLKINDDNDDRSSTTSNDVQETKTNEEEIKNNLMQRASSITTKLTDTFYRITSLSTSTPISIDYTQNLTYIDQCQFSYPLFKKVFSDKKKKKKKRKKEKLKEKNFFNISFRIIFYILIYPFIRLI